MSGSVGIAGEQLRAIIERIEHIEEEIKELTEAKKDVFLGSEGERLRRQNSSRGHPGS